MRSSNVQARIVAAACSAVAGTASMVGCASEQVAQCASDDSGASDDSSDSSATGADDSAAILQVTGTFSNTDCPSVNPLSIGPDNDGLVSVSATFNGTVDEA